MIIDHFKIIRIIKIVTNCEIQLTWVPVLWAQGELRRAYDEGLINGEHLFHALNR